jgi:hypothetical protein
MKHLIVFIAIPVAGDMSEALYRCRLEEEQEKTALALIAGDHETIPLYADVEEAKSAWLESQGV